MKYDVLVYGPLFCDLIFTDLPAMPRLGSETFAGDFTIAIGGSAIVAVALQRLGARVGLIAELGTDHMSRIARSLMDELGLDQSLIRQHPHPLYQVTVALSFPQDRAFVTRFQQPETPVDLDAILRANPARHLHVCSFIAALNTPDAAQIAHRHGLTVSMDPGWDDDALRDPRLLTMIKQLDFFFPSELELCYMAQLDYFRNALTKLVKYMQQGMVVMKRGAQGAIVRSKTDEIAVPALPVDPVDTTGAGDNFDAGFIYAHIQGKDLKTCMQYGAVCGALSTTRVGGAAAAPTQQEVEAWLAKLP
jgi:sugar/nucleoside kinase (ribokinase family)